VAPAFFIGINDPLKPGFTNANFDLFAAWEPTSPKYKSLQPSEQAIGRGEAVFNDTTFVIHDVPGLNSALSNPLYNPADPLAGQDIQGGCAICHNNPNVGNHSTSLPINIGVTMAQPTNNDGSPNNVLDIAQLPVYTLHNPATGASVAVTDPGKAMLSGNWTDIGKTKGPMLRGLAGRAPYFHNGSAKDLTTVVNFYNQRFNIGFTPQQVSDLVALLSAL
jgi:cytochrome c peroxidase